MGVPQVNIVVLILKWSNDLDALAIWGYPYELGNPYKLGWIFHWHDKMGLAATQRWQWTIPDLVCGNHHLRISIYLYLYLYIYIYIYIISIYIYIISISIYIYIFIYIYMYTGWCPPVMSVGFEHPDTAEVRGSSLTCSRLASVFQVFRDNLALKSGNFMTPKL